MSRTRSPVITFMLAVIFWHFVFAYGGPNAPYVVLFLMPFFFFLQSHQRSLMMLRWADEQNIPEGRWFLQANVFTDTGCKTRGMSVQGDFRKLVPYIGIRTPDEVLRIRTMVVEALEGGYDWVTLYNPPGLPKKMEASARSTFTLRYTALPEAQPD